jgi:hypothetical protein
VQRSTFPRRRTPLPHRGRAGCWQAARLGGAASASEDLEGCGRIESGIVCGGQTNEDAYVIKSGMRRFPVGKQGRVDRSEGRGRDEGTRGNDAEKRVSQGEWECGVDLRIKSGGVRRLGAERAKEASVEVGDVSTEGLRERVRMGEGQRL